MRQLAAIVTWTIVALVAAPFGLAATASVDGSTLKYVAASGETNFINISLSLPGDSYTVIDNGVTITPGPGCSPTIVPGQVTCAASGVTLVRIEAGDKDDWAAVGPTGAEIFGGPGNDNLRGGAAATNVLHGEGGNDTFRDGGPDTFNGGDGVDTVSYEFTPAAITATIDGNYNDGPGGVDNVGLDVENLIGGQGNDTLVGDQDANRLDGGTDYPTGNDVLNGGEGNDHLLGGNGGNDVLNGQGGNDTLDGVIGADQLNGGDGDDLLIRAFGGMLVANVLSGGDGIDVASYSLAYNSVSLTLDGVANDGSPGIGDNVMADVEGLIGGPNDDTLVGDVDANTLDGGWGDDTLLGGGGRDTVTYASRTVPVLAEVGDHSGVAGEDDLIGSDVERLIGGSANDVLNGGAGDEDLLGGQGSDLLDGGPGSDLLDGGLGDGDIADYSARSGDVFADVGDGGDDGESGEHDTLLGFEVIWGGAGDDQLSGSLGDDVLDGGPGADLLDGGPGDSNNGFDLVDYSDRDGDVFADLDGATGDDGEAGEGDTLAGDLDVIVGGAGDDELAGHGGANELDGGPGDDVLDGGLGPDELIGGEGYDSVDYFGWTMGIQVDLNGTPSDDGAPGEFDTVHASIEAVFGGDGDDVLTGNHWDNILFGRAGLDQLNGEAGDDVLNGGPGADQVSGGPGFDLADYSDRTTGVSVDLDGAAADDGAPGEGDTVASDVEDVGGGAGHDLLIGNGGENFLFGRGGNDTLDGGDSSDALFGGAGDDTLFTSDFALDEAHCGDGGADQVVADWLDALDACERISLPTPDVATGGASEVTRTTARLSGAVNPKGNATTAYWEFGPTPAYGTRTPNVSLPANAGSTVINTAISGLTPGTTYHYRLVGTNGGGTTHGQDRTFTTAAGPPPPPPPPPPPRRLCPVPKVVGQSLRIARRRITQRGCRVGKITRRPSRVVRAGIVLAQKPRWNRLMPRGTKVSIVVSSGKPRKRAGRR